MTPVMTVPRGRNMYVRGVDEASLIWEAARYSIVLLPLPLGVAEKGFLPYKSMQQKYPVPT